MKKYDYIVVGAGLYGAMFAYTKKQETKGKARILVIEKSDHISGFCHTEKMNCIQVHRYGAHIFRTDSKKVWDFVNSIVSFEPFVNSPLANYHGEVYNLPFNMNTFHSLWGVTAPQEAMAKIEETRIPCESPKNLEEYVLSVVGKDIYEKLIKDYTEKQWGKTCKELPVSTMSRIPVRFTYDNNYYNERYQGIPAEGYDAFISKLFEGCDIVLNTDFHEYHRKEYLKGATILYTGAIDRYYDYVFGPLEWRSVRFDMVFKPNVDSVYGNAVVNFTDDRPYTRAIEHKHFLRKQSKVPGTVISYEYPYKTNVGDTPSYPILNAENKAKYEKYKELADKEKNVIFGGRLGEYRYYSMNDIVEKFICK